MTLVNHTAPPFAYEEFPKIARLNRPCIISEKIDGMNALVYIRQACLNCNQDFRNANADGVDACCAAPLLDPNISIHAGSKNEWKTLEADKTGFARWVKDHETELLKLGPGRHRGEFYGAGINGNRYRLKDKRFALFNAKWASDPEMSARRPACCGVVPVLYEGPFKTTMVDHLIQLLRDKGSVLHPGERAEGLVVFHLAASTGFKVTCQDDDKPKSLA